jgi:hypothetical protein
LASLRCATSRKRLKPAGLDTGDPSSLETLTRTHILIMALMRSSMNYHPMPT